MRYSIIAEDLKTLVYTGYITLEPINLDRIFKYEELQEIEDIVKHHVLEGDGYKLSDVFKLLSIYHLCENWLKQHDYELVIGVSFVLDKVRGVRGDFDLLKISWM